uniref:Nicotianamine synthase 3 n=1 Tax=Arundo donax TaxID=35708 RepID=A0A0A9GVT9_ARUDO
MEARAHHKIMEEMPMEELPS